MSTHAQLARGHGLVAQALRFATSGAAVAAIYMASTFVLALVLPFQAALAIGFAIAIATHFTLQRLFVWARDAEYALSARAQAGRYLAIAAVQYAVTAASTAALPAATGVPTAVVYVVVTIAVTTVNFWLFRGRVFHSSDDT